MASLWKFIDSSPAIEISIRNPFLEQSFPTSASRGILAILDTGYDGFLLLPERLFKKLSFHEMHNEKVKASLADGKTTILTGAYGSIVFPSLDFRLSGLIETGKGETEILLGMEGIRNLLVELDCCKQTLKAEKCL